MSTIHLTTFIAAKPELVFDLSRSINLHKISTAGTNEEAVDGVINGLINEGESVTWRARHFFKTRRFTSFINKMERPGFFCDHMTRGDFKLFKHEHYFKAVANGTIMIDNVEYEMPYGILGKKIDKLYMNNYLKNLLTKRNNVIKEYAESQKWKGILG